MIRVHSANNGDLSAMSDIDLKGYDYPLGYLELKTLLQSKNHKCFIAASENHETVGFAIVTRYKNEGLLEIFRMAVMPHRRCEGAGAALLNAAVGLAVHERLREIFIVVPETICNPASPDDVSRWLRDNEFNAVLPLLKNRFELYGHLYDGIKFVRQINVE